MLNLPSESKTGNSLSQVYYIQVNEGSGSTHLAQVRRRISRLSPVVVVDRSMPESSFTLNKLYFTFSCQWMPTTI